MSVRLLVSQLMLRWMTTLTPSVSHVRHKFAAIVTNPYAPSNSDGRRRSTT